MAEEVAVVNTGGCKIVMMVEVRVTPREEPYWYELAIDLIDFVMRDKQIRKT